MMPQQPKSRGCCVSRGCCGASLPTSLIIICIAEILGAAGWFTATFLWNSYEARAWTTMYLCINNNLDHPLAQNNNFNAHQKERYQDDRDRYGGYEEIGGARDMASRQAICNQMIASKG